MADVFSTSAMQKAQLMQLKKGKTEEQKKAIDYFLSNGSGGCLSKDDTWKTSDYLQHVTNKINSLNLKARAIENIGLDESEIQEIEPIMLSSFLFGKDTYIKINADGAVSNQYAVTWLFFSATQVYTYKFILDTTSDNTWEITHDLFYTDITCFTTQRRVVENIKSKMVSAGGCSGCLGGQKEEFSKRNYVVDTLEIDVPQASFSFEMRNSENVERSIQAVKNMLRDKKYDK